MDLIRDEERILAWAKKNQTQQITSSILSQTNPLQGSYYEKYMEETSIYEYTFDTLIELRNQLSEMWGENDAMQDMITISAVSAMKCKPAKGKVTGTQFEGNGLDRELELPEYVYVF